jgi:hypothetical protein
MLNRVLGLNGAMQALALLLLACRVQGATAVTPGDVLRTRRRSPTVRCARQPGCRRGE